MEARISDLDGVAPNPVLVCDWVRRTRGHVDMITCATHSSLESEFWNVALLAEEMRKFRTANRTVKFIYWALHCRHEFLSEGLLDIKGGKNIMYTFAI